MGCSYIVIATILNPLCTLIFIATPLVAHFRVQGIQNNTAIVNGFFLTMLLGLDIAQDTYAGMKWKVPNGAPTCWVSGTRYRAVVTESESRWWLALWSVVLCVWGFTWYVSPVCLVPCIFPIQVDTPN
jgi:hypothetical protein